MAAYAGVGDLKARAGRLAAAWTDDSVPSEGDLEQFLEQVAAQIDGGLAAAGVTVPVTDTAAAAALQSLNVDGALILALEATWPGASGPQGVAELLAGARLRYYGVDGRSVNLGVALSLLLTQDVEAGASDYWTDEAVDPLPAKHALTREMLL